MPDSNIGSLPQVPTLDDGSLMVVEQQGQAMKMTGAQFKDFGRQSVIEEVQEYVEEAQNAAENAANAANAVANMTVAAHNLEHGQDATVSKTIINGVFHLNFGLPEGEQGIPGPEGKEGPRGPKGDTGRGLDILGYYDTLEQLEAAQPTPEVGDAYGVGTETPYDIYVFDGTTNAWKNNGPLSGGGSIVPENVVTSEGGASIVVSEDLGYPPHVISFTDEEEPPLTAADIEYKEGTVETALEGLFTSVSDGKALVASAITDKGVQTPEDATFSQMADNIAAIPTGTGTEDATANPGDILAPKTAYTAAGKVEGIIPTVQARTFTPGTADQSIAAGQYLGGTQVIKGDTNLVSANIRKGITLFGIEGAMDQTFLATLTVTVDIGAVVTATNGDTEVSALCTTGAVTLELPIEGDWTVTARRGVAQYNSVIVTVSSSYTATLTAELHIVYYGDLGRLQANSYYNPSAAVSLKGNALMGFGFSTSYGEVTGEQYIAFYKFLYKFDSVLTKSISYGSENDSPRAAVGAAAVGEHALFAGGYDYYSVSNKTYKSLNTVSAFDENLTYSQSDNLYDTRHGTAGVSIGNFALFGGGAKFLRGFDEGKVSEMATVDAYDSQLTHSKPELLALPEICKAAVNQNYGVFAYTKATAYDPDLTRTIASNLDIEPTAAARAGNYVLFIGETGANAFDLFLTRTTAERPTKKRTTGTTVKDYAVFAGGEGVNETIGADVYDSFLTRTLAQTPLTSGPYENSPYDAFCAATAGDKYAVIPGAIYESNSERNDNVIAYQYV